MAYTLTHRGRYVQDRQREDDSVDREHAVMDHNLARSRYGGFHFGAAFFGWLVSTGLAAILTSILAAGGAALAVSRVNSVSNVTNSTAATVGVASGILLLIVIAISYFAGGYVAGRLGRFDGVRQGFGTWVIGLIIAIILGVVAAGLGSKYNVLQQLNLPHIPVKSGSLTTGGWITSIAALVITLISAMVGGKIGEGFHRKVDAAGAVATDVE